MHTTIEEGLSAFKYIVSLEFFNMCIIILIDSFDKTGISDHIKGHNPKK